ncbi:MAG TPA: helix-turn-helix domain-containing protein [Chryseosolibacter sp.]
MEVRRGSEEQRSKIFRDQIVTLGDLEALKSDLIQEIKSILNKTTTAPTKKWLKSTEVKKLLGISTGTLQTLRLNGTLSHSKVGGIIFYNHDQILKLLERHEQR